MTTNYKKGAERERRIKTKFEEDGFICLRSAGSHGFADLVCINPTSNQIFFIQVKSTNFSTSQINKLEKENQFLNSNYDCKFIVLSKFKEVKKNGMGRIKR